MAYKQQKLISDSAGGYMSESTLGSGDDPLPVSDFSLDPYLAERAERGSTFSHNSYKGTIPTHENPTLITSSNSNFLPKALSPNIITLEGKVSIMNWRDTNIHSIIGTFLNVVFASQNQK